MAKLKFMIFLTTGSLILILTGLFTSKTLIEAGQLLFFISALKLIFDNYKSKTLALPKSAYYLIGFIVIALVSIWVNVEDIPRPSINRNKLKYPLMGVIGIYFFRYWLFSASERVKKWVINLFFISVLFSSIYGVFIFFQEDQYRLRGLLHTTKQAYSSSFFLIILLSALLYREKLKAYLSTPLALTTFVATFFAMALTFSRAPMFSFLLTVPLALYFYKTKLAYIFGVLSLIIGLSAVSYYFYGETNTRFRFFITKENNSDAERVSVWQTAVIAIKERPLLGWGYFNLKKQMRRIKNQYDIPEKQRSESHSHNNFLEITVSAGLIGLIPFLGWLFYWIKESFSHTWGRRIIVPFGMVFLLSGQVDLTIIDSHMLAFIYLMYAFGAALYEKREELIT